MQGYCNVYKSRNVGKLEMKILKPRGRCYHLQVQRSIKYGIKVIHIRINCAIIGLCRCLPGSREENTGGRGGRKKIKGFIQVDKQESG